MLQRALVELLQFSRIQIGQDLSLTRNPLQDIVLMCGETWSHGEVKSNLWLQEAMLRQSLELYAMAFGKYMSPKDD